MSESNYDVIIAGASFAGLAVTSQIKSGKVLLIDSKPIGVGVKSACGTILSMVSGLGQDGSVAQIHRKIILHLTNKTLTYNLSFPFCVIDGEKFCQRLFGAESGEFYQATVLGFEGKVVKTSKGDFQAKIFVDAMGPNSSDYVSFGIGTILPYREEDLHFWYEPKIFPKGIFWLFPQGKVSGFGVGSYQGKTDLKPYLDEFLARFGLKAGKLHGGYFPHRLRKVVEGEIFRVGDAAGQCLPLTGEGVRPALVFGQKCGEIIEEILAGETTLETGLKKYQNFVLAKRVKYEGMYFLERFFTSLPEKFFYPLAWLASKKPLTDFILKNYLAIIEGR